MAYTKLADSQLPLYYELRGAPDAPLVIFVNGWCLSGRYWQPVVESLASSHLCLTYDSRGFGRSRPPNQAMPADFQATIDSGAAELLGLVQKLNLWQPTRPIHIVGHSLGAVIAAHFATQAEANKRLASLTIVNSGSFDESEPQGSRLNTFVKIFVRVKSLFELPLIRNSVIQRSAAQPIPSYYQRILVEDLARSDSRLALELSLSSLTIDNLRRYRTELVQLKAPLLLIVGDKDATIPPKGMYNIKHFKAASSFVAFADCGHLPMLEQPAKFIGVLAEHTGSIPNRQSVTPSPLVTDIGSKGVSLS